MQYTGKSIIKTGIISNIENPEKQMQQQGVDLTLKSIYPVITGGYIGVENKDNAISKTSDQPIQPTKSSKTDKPVYHLKPGYYEVYFNESCNVPIDATLHLKTRSTLVRSGAHISAGQYDAGFKADSIGGFLNVINPEGISIEHNARICQAIVFRSERVEEEDLYGSGKMQSQYQGKSK